MLPIRIAVGDLDVDGMLNDSDGARALARALPLTAEFSVWGDELHFGVDLDHTPRERPAATVAVGDMGLTVEDSTLCIFFGPTPLSPAEDPVAAVPVVVVGRLDDVERLRERKEAGSITIRARNGHEG
ncbi:MAG: cyclophilin-like fold protein [Acidobacteriota bacterium]